MRSERSSPLSRSSSFIVGTILILGLGGRLCTAAAPNYDDTQYFVKGKVVTIVAADCKCKAGEADVYWRIRPVDAGQATGATNNSLTQTGKNWENNQWQGGTIRILTETGFGQTKEIASNTATTITINGTWTTNPDATSTYDVTAWYKGETPDKTTQGTGTGYDGKWKQIPAPAAGKTFTLSEASVYQLWCDCPVKGTYEDSDGLKKILAVWVVLHRRDSGTMATDNSGRTAVIQLDGNADLGSKETTVLWKIRSEFLGVVTPYDWDKSVKIWRQMTRARTCLGANQDNSPGTINTNGQDDTSYDDYRDDDPQSGGSNGRIYDTDGPGLAKNSTLPKDTIRRQRMNFYEYAKWGTTSVSDKWYWYSRQSIKRTTDPPTNTWVRENGVGNDNQHGDGTTKVSWNLASPTATGITPNSGTNNGPVNITNLAGASFVTNAVVKLRKGSQADITATNVQVDNTSGSTIITCTFGLNGAAPGTWNVEVKNPDDDSAATLTNGFTVNAP